MVGSDWILIGTRKGQSHEPPEHQTVTKIRQSAPLALGIATTVAVVFFGMGGIKIEDY